MHFKLIAFCVPVLLWCASCNEPTLLGSDLLEGEQGEILFSDTFNLEMTTLKGDSVRSYGASGGQLSNYLFGDFQDPVFGKTKAEIYLRLEGPNAIPGFAGGTLDSMVLVLPYDTGGVYGDISGNFGMELFEIAEDLDYNTSYYSNASFDVSNMAVGSKTFVPNPTDSITIKDANAGAEVDVRHAAEFRMVLDQAFAESFFNADTTTFLTDSAFLEKYKGFYLKPAVTTPGMLSFDLLDANAGLYIYYHVDTSFRRYRFLLDDLAVLTFQHDYSGSYVEPFIGDASNDSLHFVQGGQGLTVEIKLPELNDMQNIIINKAELEFFVPQLPGDDLSVYSPVEQVWLLRDQGDTTKIAIDDVAFPYSASRNLAQLIAYFGGNVKDGPAGLKKYKMNIAAHLQDQLRGEVSNRIYLEVFNRANRISRSVLYGPGNSNYPAKLSLHYTVSSE